MKKQWRAMVFWMLGGSALLGAQEVRAVLESPTAYVGQPVGFTIRISGEEKASRPDLGAIPGVAVEAAGESSSVRATFSGGSGSKTVLTDYSWRLTPRTAGEVRIPPIEVKLGGRVARTEPLTLLVNKPEALEGFHLFMSLPEGEVFPGMPLRLTMKWLFSAQVAQLDFTLPFQGLPGVDARPLPAPSSQSNDVYQFVLDGETVYAVQSAEIYQGEQYASLTMSWDLYFDRPGTVRLDPAVLGFKRSVGRDRWGNLKYEDARIPSNALVLQVSPLPEQLREAPEGILIARGPLKAELTLNQTRVYPGDPITAEIRFKNLMRPDKTDFKGLAGLDALSRGGFRVDAGAPTTFVEGEELRVRQVVRAAEGELSRFPSLELRYYDALKGRVETLRTDPLALEVIPLAAAEAKELLLPSVISSPEAEEGVSLGFNRLLTEIRPGWYESIPLWAYWLLPPLLFLGAAGGLTLASGGGLLLWRNLFRRKEAERVLWEERLRLWREDPSPENSRILAELGRGRLARRLGLPRSFTEAQLEGPAGEELPRETRREILLVLRELDRLSWSPGEQPAGGVDPAVLYDFSGRERR